MVKLKKPREEIIQKADELGQEYAERYLGCGQSTFLAVVDALRWGGLELMPEDMEDRLFSGVCVLTGGISMTGDGSCGALSSGALLIGMALGIPRQGQDDSILRAACATVYNTIVDRFYREYRSLLCKDVQRKFFGKAWDLTNDEMSMEFLGITQGCVIMQAAAWTTEIILDELEKGNVRLPA